MSAARIDIEEPHREAAGRIALLDARDVTVRLREPGGNAVTPVREVSFGVYDSEIVGVVGESGSGKTTLARALTRLFPEGVEADVRGSVMFTGRDLLTLREEELRAIRGQQIAYVFQSADTALNPTRTIGHQMSAVMRAHRPISKAACHAEAVEFLELVEIPEAANVLKRFPHQLSGGMKQRVMIGMALANRPALLIADEPTSSLDVLVRERIIELFDRLRRELGFAILIISHDLHLVAKIADRVIVFYGGRIVEIGRGSTVLREPMHRYTSALLKALPSVDTDYAAAGSHLEAIPGTPVGARDSAVGCAFAPRCAFSGPVCLERQPGLVRSGEGRTGAGDIPHLAACWFPSDAATEADDK